MRLIGEHGIWPMIDVRIVVSVTQTPGSSEAWSHEPTCDPEQISVTCCEERVSLFASRPQILHPSDER